jgi:NADH-quinone oxidoreductase subunit M
VVGRMVYDRTHTRKLEELRAMSLYKLLPFAALVFVVAGLASMGMPGFSGFPAELTILVGAWKTSPAWAAVAALGILVAAAYTLRVIQVAFFGQNGTMRGEPASLKLRRPGGTPPTNEASVAHALPPITLPERVGAILLIAAAVLIGLKPDLLLNWIIPCLQSPLMKAVLK